MPRVELTPELNDAIKTVDRKRRKLGLPSGPTFLSSRVHRATPVCSRWINGRKYIEEKNQGVGPSLPEIPIIEDAYEVVPGTLFEECGWIDALELVLQKLHPDYQVGVRHAVESATELTAMKIEAESLRKGVDLTGRLFPVEPFEQVQIPKAS